MYICPKCKKSTSKDIRKLLSHLRHVHALSDGQDYTIVCSQNNCQRTYHNFNSYAKHLNREHAQAANPVHSEQDSDTSMSENFSSASCSAASCSPAVDVLETYFDGSSNCSTSDFQSCAAAFVAKMYSSSNCTLTDVQRSITCTKELLCETLDCLQERTTSLLNRYSVPNDELQTLMKDFERGRNMFEEVDTPYKMTKYFAENHSFVKPTEIFLGNRGDTARKQGKLTQVLIADTCQYISIIDTLKFLFDNEQMQKLFVDSTESDGKLRDYCDGSHFKNHKLYSRFPQALQIQLYFDDFETTNPLGSKTKVHKMGAVYFCLGNLPSRFNSSLENIHLCLLFNSIDREVYGFNKIFEPLLDDIKLLETRGLEVQVNGQSSVLFGTICLFTADNLACHSLGGYLESFAANKSCHFCLIDKHEMQSIFDDDCLELRNEVNYNEHVMLKNPSLTGIKADSCLNSLEYFHITDNVCVDIMHDILEGVAPLEIKLMLQHFIYEQKLFTLDQLNDRMKSFDYGVTNAKNKPSAIHNLRTSENPIKQNASQMWCLILFLPFLIGNFISEGESHWKLFLLLKEICSILFAPVVTKGLAVFFKAASY